MSPPTFTVDPALDGIRADGFLGRVLPGRSRRERAGLFSTGCVEVEGRPVRKGDPLSAGANVSVRIDGPDSPPPEPALPVSLLHVDDTLLALDKPAGMPALARGPGDRGTLANFLRARFPETRDASPNPLEAGVAHRLDTATSGVLLVARSRGAWRELRRQFSERTIDKHYLALVAGRMERELEITSPIRSARTARVRIGRGGRPALTRVRPLRSGDDETLVAVQIETGVRHQIRVHLASVGHPVIGDGLYAGPEGPRLFLHATAVAFRHPETGAPIRIESPAPFDTARAVSR